MSKLIPLPGYILIEPIEEEDTTVSGLVLPESAKEKPAKGKVLAVEAEIGNEDDKYRDAQVKEGQVVVFKKWGGQDVEDQGKELKLVKFDEVMGVYEEKKE